MHKFMLERGGFHHIVYHCATVWLPTRSVYMMRRLMYIGIGIAVWMLPVYGFCKNKQEGQQRMKLGNAAHIAVSCNDITASLPFYTALGFTTLYTDNETAPSIARITDGMIVLALIREDFGTPALAYFTTDIQNIVYSLQQLHIDVQTGTGTQGEITQAHCIGPNGVSIWIHPHRNALQPSGTTNPVCGSFGELSIGIDDLASSLQQWEKLGFNAVHQSTVPYPFAIISDGAMVIGLYQSGTLYKPTITYFASDMASRIAQLQKAGIVVTEEFPPEADGSWGGAFTQSPDGQRFFFFEDTLQHVEEW